MIDGFYEPELLKLRDRDHLAPNSVASNKISPIDEPPGVDSGKHQENDNCKCYHVRTDLFW